LSVCFSGEDEEEEEVSEKEGKAKNDLRGHLNGLYNGLAKIMSTTCKIDSNKSLAPFAIEKAVHNIMFIKHHMKRQDEFDAVRLSVCLSVCLSLCFFPFDFLLFSLFVFMSFFQSQSL
jgi:hypothetical protein